jgi:hypothetical protein
MLKNFLLFLLCSCVALVSKSQDQRPPIPGNGYAIYAPKSVTVISGASQKLAVQVVRSKLFRKQKIAMHVVSVLPEGITITFNPDTNFSDSYEMLIYASSVAKPGEYSLIISGKNMLLNKGRILKLKIDSVSGKSMVGR